MKKIISTILAIAFALSTTGAAFAASSKCTVTAVEGSKLILDCGDKAENFPVGSQVKIKSKTKAIEGC